MNKGFYFAFSIGDVFGLSFGIIYVPEEKDFQIAMMVGWMTLAVGYSF